MGQTNLPEAIVESLRMWPTPVADGDRTTNYAQGGTSLGFAVRNLWPTPTSSEHKYRLQGNSQQSKSLNGQAGGKLNPTWVEWLMGWPLGWTDCAASAMDKYQRWRRLHGACLGVADETA
jgi:DNA (cytosine-5)-methyltransferase 1